MLTVKRGFPVEVSHSANAARGSGVSLEVDGITKVGGRLHFLVRLAVVVLVIVGKSHFLIAGIVHVDAVRTEADDPADGRGSPCREVFRRP